MSSTESTESSSESGRSSPQYTTTRRIDEEEWEVEVEEEDSLVEEFREVWHLSHTITTFDDTGDSLDSDDSEQIRAKLRALREYVRDLQSSYEELMDTFAQLENAARDRVAALEQQLINQAKKFQQRHDLLEQEIAVLRAGTKSCPIDQQTQTNVESVLEAVEQDTAGVLATVDGLCTGVMKLRSEEPLSSQPASSSSYIPPASGMEEASPLVPTQHEKEEKEHDGFMGNQKSVDVPDLESKIVNSQEGLTTVGEQDRDEHSSTTNGQPQMSLGSEQNIKETREQGVQVGGEEHHQMLEPAEQLKQGDALLPEEQRAWSNYEEEEAGAGLVNQETGKQGHFAVDQTGYLKVYEQAECFMDEDNWQGQLGGFPRQQHVWIGNRSPHSDKSDGALVELLEKDCTIAELETRVQSLEHDLQEARLNQYKAAAVSNQDEEEVVSVRRELHQLRCQRSKLDEEVEKTRQELHEIQQKREEMQKQVDQLQQRMRWASPTEAKSTETQDVKEEIQKRSVSVQVELSIQQALLDTSLAESVKIREGQEEAEESYREAMRQTSEAKSQLGEAKARCHQLEMEVASKELELQTLMSAIHTSKAQLTGMVMSSDDGNSDHSSLASDIGRLSPREQVAQNLVETVASHAQQWNKVQSAAVEHQGVIAELQGQEMQLNSEISQQEARVIELEALLQARQLRDSSEMAKLSSTQAELELLQSLLLRTREEHAAACDEISAMHNSLAQSVVPLFKSLDTVKRELSAKSRELEEAKAQGEQLQTEYTAACSLIEEAEQGRLEAEEKWKMAARELQEQRQSIVTLEEELAEEHRRHADDVDQQAAAIAALSDQLDLLDEEHSSHSFELLSLASEKTALQGKLEKRDQLLETLQQQTSQLLQQHKEALQEVEERGELVRGLETDLSLAQTLCDALQQEVADGQDRITDLQQQLQDSHHHQLQLTHQLHKLQEEAEEACRSLETALKHNSIQSQQSGTAVRTLETHLDAERSVTSRLHQRVTDLLGTTQAQQKKIWELQELVRKLDADSSQLRADQQWREEAIISFQERMDSSAVKETSLLDRSAHELSETRVVMEQLQQLVRQKDEELAAYESQKLMLESLAQERLQEVIALQQQLYHAGSRAKYAVSREKLETSASLQLSHDLQVDTESLNAMYEEKCIELERLRTEHRLLMDKEAIIDQQLEECRREVRLCKERASELEAKYTGTLDELAQCQMELASFKELSTLQDATRRSLEDQLQSDQQGHLESLKLKEAQRKLQAKDSALEAAQDEKQGLLHRLSTLEEHHDSLIRSHSQLRLDLNRVRAQLRNQRQRNQEAHAAEQLSQRRMASDEALNVQPRELESEAASMESAHLLRPMDESPPPPVHSSLYQTVLEKGLSSGSALNTSGYSSPAEHSDDLDKQYWIRRASELSLQLQDSSEFWTGKVRELSYRLEKYESGQK